MRVGGGGEGATRFSVLVTILVISLAPLEVESISPTSVTTIEGGAAKPELAGKIVSAPSVCPIYSGGPEKMIGLNGAEFFVAVPSFLLSKGFRTC